MDSAIGERLAHSVTRSLHRSVLGCGEAAQEVPPLNFQPESPKGSSLPALPPAPSPPSEGPRYEVEILNDFFMFGPVYKWAISANAAK